MPHAVPCVEAAVGTALRGRKLRLHPLLVASPLRHVVGGT